jgi:hypothetical protein
LFRIAFIYFIFSKRSLLRHFRASWLAFSLFSSYTQDRLQELKESLMAGVGGVAAPAANGDTAAMQVTLSYTIFCSI